MSTRTILAAAVSACLLSPLTARAADPQPAPATTASSMKPVNATVSAVAGMVAVRDSEEAPWRKPAVGMVVPVGVEVRTGPRSSITFALPHQTLTLDRLGTMKLLEALAGDERLKTDVGMQYGRVRYAVEAAGMEHESIIRSPSNALAIRGSDVEVTEDGLDSNVVVYKGQGQVVTTDGYAVTLGRSAEADYGRQPYTVSGNNTDPVQNWFGQTTPPYSNSVALSQGEQQLVSTNTSVGGMETGVGSWTWRGRGWQGGGTVPQAIDNGSTGGGGTGGGTGGGGVGNLRFALSWTGHNEPGTRLPDLDLFVLAPGGTLLSPKGVTQSGTGRITGDAGGSIATSGRETAEFIGAFPLGNYRYGVDYVSGEDPATFNIDIRLNGQRVNPDYEDTVTPDDTRVAFTIGISLADGQGTAAQAKGAKAAKAAGKPSAKKPVAKTPQKPAKPKKQPPLRPQKIAASRR